MCGVKSVVCCCSIECGLRCVCVCVRCVFAVVLACFLAVDCGIVVAGFRCCDFAAFDRSFLGFEPSETLEIMDGARWEKNKFWREVGENKLLE